MALAAAALVGVSAFAESRPDNETRVRRDAGGAVRRERAVSVEQRAPGNETRNADSARGRAPLAAGSVVEVQGSRSSERSIEGRRDGRGGDERSGVIRRERDSRRTTATRDRGRSDDRRDGSYRGDDRRRGEVQRGSGTRGRTETYRDGRGSRGNDSYRRDGSRSYGQAQRGRQPYYAHGRVSRVHRHGNGYRVWVHGARYPFYVPLSHWHRDRFRVGVMIRVGGWYNDAGYYDYYDGRSTGELYGIVESVDYRRDSFVVRNEATGSFVTVVARDRETDRLRAGDVVEIYGDWRRSGLFDARDVDVIDSYRR